MATPPLFMPLWPRPGAIETLEWMTDVMTPEDGAEEERTEMRETPRQSFQYSYFVPQHRHAEINNILYPGRALQWYVPVWPQVQHIGAVSGGATSLTCDTRYTEFIDGGKVLLWQFPNTYQLLDMAAVVSDSSISLAEPADAFTDAYLIPVRLGYLARNPTRKLSGTSSVLELTYVAEDNENIAAGPDTSLPWADRGTDYFVIGASQEISGVYNNARDQSWFKGYIDSVRVTKGVARYTGASLTVPTAEFPNDGTDPYWDDVITLLRFNGSNNDTTTTCEKGSTVTMLGGAKISTAQSKFGGSSAFFDGVDDYVKTVVGSSGQALGDTYTIEGWVYLTDRVTNSHSSVMLSAGAVNQAGHDTGFGVYGDKVAFYQYGSPGSSSDDGSVAGTDEVVPLNTWVHIAICRDGDDELTYLYANGAIANPSVLNGIPDQYLGNDLYTDPGLLEGGKLVEELVTRFDLFDEDLGQVSYSSPWTYDRLARVHNMVGDDAAENWDIKLFLFRRRGRAKLFWQPTFENDFRVNQTGAITTTLVVRADAYPDNAEARVHIAVETAAGWFPREVTAINEVDVDHLELTLDTSLGVDAEDILRVCRLGLRRLDADRIEIAYPGAMVCNVGVPTVEVQP